MALNGAGAIHDFELAMIGATTESVARYVSTGEFGLWQETARFNEAAVAAQRDGIGLGEALGRMIEHEAFPYRETSVLAAGVRLGVPVTVHVGIGQDIVHMHPNFDAGGHRRGLLCRPAGHRRDRAAAGRGRVPQPGHGRDGAGGVLEGPDHGAQRGPSAGRGDPAFHHGGVRYRRARRGNSTARPAKSDPRYYFRPYKSVLVRTVADGGKSHYVQGDHRQTIPALYDEILKRAERMKVLQTMPPERLQELLAAFPAAAAGRDRRFLPRQVFRHRAQPRRAQRGDRQDRPPGDGHSP